MPPPSRANYWRASQVSVPKSNESCDGSRNDDRRQAHVKLANGAHAAPFDRWPFAFIPGLCWSWRLRVDRGSVGAPHARDREGMAEASWRNDMKRATSPTHADDDSERRQLGERLR